MSDKYLVNLALAHTPSLTAEEVAEKNTMETLYQNVRDRISAEHCTRLEIQELYFTIFSEKGEGTLAEKVANRLEVDQEDELDIGLDTFFSILSESCSYEDKLTAEAVQSAFDSFKELDSEDSADPFAETEEETEEAQEGDTEEVSEGAVSEYDDWTADLVGEGEWVSTPPALFNRIGNFIELPFPCLIHDIQPDWVDVVSLETLQLLA